ncbi:hypothetical protein QPK24_04340 [Paenibacillus polygoni]|uniref:Uncharacterized protein n=1 Tax=Paenibacillus polygoni TaxID=3050112 RepID=A0ABY8X4I8_9BACL|nr:hypothetical protein [Paenibacillus polygoni]WIV19953.1 hypothetical protein QPK24_04340 [Paenibacillus polygoni]
MKKRVTVFVLIFLCLLLIALLINKNKADNESESKYYLSFVSSVQTLDRSLDLIQEDQEPDKIAEGMFDVYTSFVFSSFRLDLFKSNAPRSIDLDILANDFLLLRTRYEPLVRNQITNKDDFNFEDHAKFKSQIHLFVNELPEKYENSKEFVEKLNKASEHIKPLIS